MSKNLRSKKTSADQKLRVLLVGVGYFGSKRLQACLDLKAQIEIVGIVDANQQRLTELETQYDLVTATSIEAFSEQDIDLVIISTPNNTHAQLAIKSLSFGWNVLCEKPLATTAKEAKKIEKAAKKYGKIVKTGSNHRFFSSVKKAKELFEKGEIGDILHLQGTIGNSGNQTANSWFWNKEVSGGGTYIDNACHLLDIARMFMGDFQQCVGHAANVFWKKSQVEDIGTGIFIKKNGAQAVISSTWFQWYGYLYIEIWGSKGFMIIDSRNGDTLTIGKKGSSDTVVYDFSADKKDSYHQELLYLAQCITLNKSPHPNATDGTAVISMIEGVYESVKTKKWVKL